MKKKGIFQSAVIPGWFAAPTVEEVDLVCDPYVSP